MLYRRVLPNRIPTLLAVIALFLPGLFGSGLVGVASAHATPARSASTSAIPQVSSPDGDPLLLVHGFQDTCDFAFNRTDEVPNTGLNANTTVEYLENNGWDASALDLVGYYASGFQGSIYQVFQEARFHGDTVNVTDGTPADPYSFPQYSTVSHSCTSNLQELNDTMATSLCSPLLNGQQAGTPNDPLEHLGCLLAWYIYDTYGGRPIDILAHSMGGLIVRDAIGESGHNSKFPPTRLNVHVVVTVGTPHGGVWGSYYAAGVQLSDVQELRDMFPDSSFMQLLGTSLLMNPQGLFGTHWALMASSIYGHDGTQSDTSRAASMLAEDDPLRSNYPFPDGDGVVQADSALDMPADFKILYGSGVWSTSSAGGVIFGLFNGSPLYTHEANTCQPACLTYPFYLNDGTSGYTSAWVCNANCDSGSLDSGGGSNSGIDDVDAISNGVATTPGPALYSLAEIVSLLGTYGPGTAPASSGSGRMVAISGTNTFVAIGNTLYKYDLGNTGNDIFSLTTNGTSGGDYIGNQVYSYPITAIAANGQYLYVALSNHRVIKTTLCGSGNTMCALSDGSGSGSMTGYHYWIGYQNWSMPVTGLAATTSYLFTNLAGSTVRTVKTTVCGSGANMCALSDGIGSGSLNGWNYWVGYQNWAWAPSAIAANDSLVLITIGATRVCKTTLGSSGSNVFALSDDGECTGSYSSSYHSWYGYQDWDTAVTSLALDNAHIWWGLGNLGGLSNNQGRLVQTTWCGTGSNVCALSDGIGSGSLSSKWNYWVGYQDWCSNDLQMGVASNGQFVDALFTFGDYTRVVKTNGGGSWQNMFNLADCTGTSGSTPWLGYQDFTVS